MAAVPDSAAAAVDERNPWLGLSSFTEETRAYFFGRDAEVAELARRVQRRLLTVLFGQSGLGKTSILRAGLVPRLRAQGYCPVYVRIDYARGTPEPAEQIKAAISATARTSGQWTQAGVAVAGESLWEYLHHRDDELRDAQGARVTPLLIFDQFEEIFTLAQGDEFGRARAARFIEELADLVENRPPRALQAKFDEDESVAGRFDFARSDYRVLLALREDYLAPLESLKGVMPSVSQNRLRLAPMNGEQALAAVQEPGKGLVSEEVAAAIVRFVAGGAEVANAEVEPSLLSLICRELNDARLTQGRAEISQDLLAGSHTTILSNFYARALADQPEGVRRVIEDDLLTASGFRENVAEERLLKRFAEVGAGPATLALLVNRRLLRIEERLDVRRVELTHDVLCGVVKASRDQRQAREAKDAAERALGEQRAREQAAHRALVRARKIASVCTLLAVAAVAAAVLAYFSSERARRAERQAQQTQAIAESARAQSEHLLSYLADDFVRELELSGRLDLLKDFSQRQIDYFHALPAPLKSADSTRNAALALVHHARALRSLGQPQAALKDLNEALTLLEGLRPGGDTSDGTTTALALAHLAQFQVRDNIGDPQALESADEALALITPVAQAATATRATRAAYIDVLTRTGYGYFALQKYPEALKLETQARALTESMGALDMSDPDMTAFYLEATSWYIGALALSGQMAEARRQGDAAYELGTRLLLRRPGNRLALHAMGVIGSGLLAFALEDLDPRRAAQLGERNDALLHTLLDLDPENVVALNNLGDTDSNTGNAFLEAGDLKRAVEYLTRAPDAGAHAAAREGNVGFLLNSITFLGSLGSLQAQLGDSAGLTQTLERARAAGARLAKVVPPGTARALLADEGSRALESLNSLMQGNPAQSQRLSREAVTRLEHASVEGGSDRQIRESLLGAANGILAMANLELADYPGTEVAARAALEHRRASDPPGILGTQRDLNEVTAWLAAALARQGKPEEARALLAPALKLQRELLARNKTDVWLHFELARLLYAQACAEPARRAALLREAAGEIAASPPQIAATPIVAWLKRLIARG
jgi:tetratricopeptide (TPR) repeat protein